MLPRLRRIIGGSARRQQRNTLVKSASNTWRQSPQGHVGEQPLPGCAGVVDQALYKAEVPLGRGEEGFHLGLLGQVRLVGFGRAPQGQDVPLHLAGGGLVAAVVQGHVPAAAGQLQGRGGAYAPRGPCHQHGFHVASPLRSMSPFS